MLVNLFQAGRKKNFGFMDNRLTMLYLPVKPDDLVNWLNCFNVGKFLCAYVYIMCCLLLCIFVSH